MARPPSDLSNRILFAARERFLVEGVDGASLRQIAKDAKTNIGMVYYYFPTKDDLFSAVVEDVYERLLADVVERLAPDVPAEARLERLLLRFAELRDEEFKVVRLILREAMISSHRLTNLVDRFQRGHLPFVLGTILEGQEQGRLTSRQPGPLLMASMMAIAVMPQLVLRLAREGDVPAAAALPDAQTVAHMLFDVLMRGIGGDATVPR